MNRRDFLSTLFGATTAALMLPPLEAIASALPELDTLGGPAWTETFDRTLREAWRFFQKQYGTPVPFVPVTGKIGERPGGILVTSQWGIVVGTDGRLLDEAMQSLADGARTKIQTFTVPPMVVPGVTFCGTLGALRMIVAYDIQTDRNLTRFDVMGGHRAA